MVGCHSLIMVGRTYQTCRYYPHHPPLPEDREFLLTAQKQRSSFYPTSANRCGNAPPLSWQDPAALVRPVPHTGPCKDLCCLWFGNPRGAAHTTGRCSAGLSGRYYTCQQYFL